MPTFWVLTGRRIRGLAHNRWSCSVIRQADLLVAQCVMMAAMTSPGDSKPPPDVSRRGQARDRTRSFGWFVSSTRPHARTHLAARCAVRAGRCKNPSMGSLVIRSAVVYYSKRNRKRKADTIAEWMRRHECRSVLLVGALGSENTDPNTSIVEDSIQNVGTVKMGFNIDPQVDTPYPFIVADARQMPFEDDYVDFAVANAIIEHVGDENDQVRMVQEHIRVARCWAITTPNKWFPIESHTSTILLHWFPRWRRNRDEFTRLLSRREFARMLPDDVVLLGSWWSPTFTALYARS